MSEREPEYLFVPNPRKIDTYLIMKRDNQFLNDAFNNRFYLCLNPFNRLFSWKPDLPKISSFALCVLNERKMSESIKGFIERDLESFREEERLKNFQLENPVRIELDEKD